MTPEEGEFVDRIGQFLENVGAPRTIGRIYGRLLICDPPQQSLTELATALGVSKASISTMIRPMREGGLVERLPSASRQHTYRVAPGGFTHLLQVQLARMQAGVDAAEFGLSVLGEDQQQQRARLVDLRDFCRFTTELADGLMQQWKDYHPRNRTEQ